MKFPIYYETHMKMYSLSAVFYYLWPRRRTLVALFVKLLPSNETASVKVAFAL
jgi:hypothetical protein